MTIGVPKEVKQQEFRVAIPPSAAYQLIRRGHRVLVESNAGCTIQWSADVQQLGGLLKAVPAGLIQAGAERVINDLLANVEKKLNE